MAYIAQYAMLCIVLLDKKLSYRRDIAHRRSVPGPFQVIQSHATYMRICDLVLANNGNLHPVSHRCPIIVQLWSNCHL